MSADRLTRDQLLEALQRVGDRLSRARPDVARAEALLVGGAAGMVTGVFRPERTTRDCDMVEVLPEDLAAKVEEQGKRAAAELGLDEAWLNSQASWFTGVMLDGWKERRQFIGRFGALEVFAASRLDLIALKFYAHRDQDVDDLEDLAPTQEEARRVRRHLERCTQKGFSWPQIEPAIEFLEAYMGYR